MPDEAAKASGSRRSRPITDVAGYLIALTAAVGIVITLAIDAAGYEPAYQNRALHVAKETAAALVLLLAAALLIGRFRRNGALLNLLALAGVLLLASKNLVFSVAGAIATETEGGITTWRTTGAGMLGAALLAAAALTFTRIAAADRRRAVMLTAACSVASLVALTGVALAFDLPAVFTDQPESRADLARFHEHPALLFADSTAAFLFLLAGAAFAWRAQREADEFQFWLGLGSTIAGIAYLNYALSPSSYTDFLYTGDVFRVLAVGAWGIGTIREIAVYQAAYTKAAVLDERRRVARDLHDGVAQELAFISSQMHWLKSRPQDQATAGQIMEAVERALDESRGAISAMSRPLNEPLHLALSHAGEEVADRLGAKLVLDLDEAVVVPPAWEEALPRILREAIANAVRHGSARTITVYLRDADGIWLRVTDDGCGFDASELDSQAGFGLISMQERTEALGGELRLSSEPGEGTAVEILVVP
jgi:signal transduction histidine kinase